jgi:purine-cytosine permease-like protein
VTEDRIVLDGIEPISAAERRGAPRDLFWTWSAPNWKFATMFVGVLPVAVFGGGFWPTVMALVLGSAFGAATVAVLSSWGPRFGIAQLVQSRAAFGYHGNRIPATLNAVSAGVGWFAVNTLTAAFALVTLIGLPCQLILPTVVVVQVTLACCGLAAISRFTRLVAPGLTVVFGLVVLVVLGQARPDQEFNASAAGAAGGPVGVFLLTFSIAFGYAISWAPCAMDFARFLPSGSNGRAVAGYVLIGVLLPCLVLEVGGAGLATVAGTAWGPADSPTDQLARAVPGVLGSLALLGIAVGAVSANVLNCYSGALSFMALGLRFGNLQRHRAIVAILLGGIGYVLALAGAENAGRGYQDFLLLLGYWIAPFLGVVFADMLQRRGRFEPRVFVDRSHSSWTGTCALLVGIAASAPFWNQMLWRGPVVDALPQLGDVSFLVGFVAAAATYAACGLVGRALREALAVAPHRLDLEPRRVQELA